MLHNLVMNLSSISCQTYMYLQHYLDDYFSSMTDYNNTIYTSFLPELYWIRWINLAEMSSDGRGKMSNNYLLIEYYF